MDTEPDTVSAAPEAASNVRGGGRLSAILSFMILCDAEDWLEFSLLVAMSAEGRAGQPGQNNPQPGTGEDVLVPAAPARPLYLALKHFPACAIVAFMGMSTYDFSYALRRRLRRRILFGVLYVFALFLIFSLIRAYLLFSVTVRNTALPNQASRTELLLVTPLASPLAADERRIPVLTPIFHSVDLERGNLVYVLPQYSEKLPFWQAFIDSFTGFITFQQYFPFSRPLSSAHNPSVRRLAALPGDTIYMENFVLYVRPAGQQYFLTEFELSENQYDILIKNLPENWDTLLGSYGTFAQKTLGGDEFFVLADNRTENTDSRIWGPVNAKQIGGRIFLRLFPFNTFSLL